MLMKLLMTKKKLPVRFTGQHFTIDKVLIKDAIRQAKVYKKTDFLRPVNKKVKTATIFVVKTRS